jgi:hypothetical protein
MWWNEFQNKVECVLLPCSSVMNNTSTNMGISITQDSDFNSSDYTHRNGISGSHSNSGFSFLEKLTVFSIDYTILYSYQQCKGFQISLQALPNISLKIYNIIDIYINSSEVFIFTSLMIKDVEHLLCVLLAFVYIYIYFEKWLLKSFAHFGTEVFFFFFVSAVNF